MKEKKKLFFSSVIVVICCIGFSQGCGVISTDSIAQHIDTVSVNVGRLAKIVWQVVDQEDSAKNIEGLTALSEWIGADVVGMAVKGYHAVKFFAEAYNALHGATTSRSVVNPIVAQILQEYRQ